MHPGLCTRYTSRDIEDRSDDPDPKRDGMQIVGVDGKRVQGVRVPARFLQ